MTPDALLPRLDAPLPHLRVGEDGGSERGREEVAEEGAGRDALSGARGQRDGRRTKRAFERTKQTSGRATRTPKSAPPSIERYIEPGIEKAWRLRRETR